MICVRCDKHLTECNCSDIEERLRQLMKTGNAQTRHWAKEALFERLASKKITADMELDDEMAEVFEWCLNKQWAKQAQLN